MRSSPSAAAAGTWTLGDLTVNRIGFGAMRLTGSAAFHLGTPSDRARSIATLRRAVDLGVNHIDTASFYFSSLRSANELINSALSPYPEGLVIATKVGPSRDASGSWLPPATPQELRGQVEENLRQLGRDHLDLVYLRVQSRDSVREHVTALAALRDTGLIRHVGISGVSPAQLREAMAVAPIVSVQNRFSVDIRRSGDDEVLRICGRHGIAFVPFFAIAGKGAEKGVAESAESCATDTHHQQVAAVAQAHGATPAQVRLAWTLHQGLHVLAIPGTGNPDHLVENVAAGALRLSEEELAQLET